MSRVLQVLSCGGPAWWVQGPAPFAATRGHPPGGPLDPAALVDGLAALDAPPGARPLAVEHTGVLEVAAGEAPLWLAQVEPDAVALWRLRAGERLRLPGPTGARVAGLVIGADAAHAPTAGPWAPLPPGAWAAAGPPWSGPRAPKDRIPRPRPRGPVRVLPVADAGPDAWSALVDGQWAVAPAADRRGVALVGGPRAPGAGSTARSRPVVPGAIQALPDGRFVVLGPDGPTLGGYPLVGVVLAADRGRVWNAAPGAKVAFAGRGARDAHG